MVQYLTVTLAMLVLLAGCAAVQPPEASAVSDSILGAESPPAGDDATVSVAASGSAEAAPDIAILRLAVTHIAPTADEARDRVTTDTERMRAALRNLGVPDENVSTTAFSIHVVYHYDGPERGIDGYRAVHAVRVETAPGDAGSVLDAAVDGGATRVDGVQFTLSDSARRSLRAKALGDAMANAESDATALAAAADVTVDRVSSISTTERGSGPVPLFEGHSGDASTTLDPGPVTVTTHVSVVYAVA